MTAPIEGDAPDAFGNAKQRSTRAKDNAPKAAALPFKAEQASILPRNGRRQ